SCMTGIAMIAGLFVLMAIVMLLECFFVERADRRGHPTPLPALRAGAEHCHEHTAHQRGARVAAASDPMPSTPSACTRNGVRNSHLAPQRSAQRVPQR
ncbi:MAG: hypothetical protein WBP59_09390, partial [Ilumatobacteraceae bacterium]